MRSSSSAKRTKIDRVVSWSDSDAEMTPLSVNPYTAENRKKMMTNQKVDECILASNNAMKSEQGKILQLPASMLPKQKLKKSVTMTLDENTAIEVCGLLGSGAFAQVFAVKMKTKTSKTPLYLAMKVSCCCR